MSNAYTYLGEKEREYRLEQNLKRAARAATLDEPGRRAAHAGVPPVGGDGGRTAAARFRVGDINSAAVAAGITGFLFIIFGALTLQVSVIEQLGLSDAEGRSWIFMTWLTSGVMAVSFSAKYRQPLAIGWSAPALVYMASLSGRFSYEELVTANMLAGILILAIGVAGLGEKMLKLVPGPILMGMFAASIVGFVTHAIESTASDFRVVVPMVAAYMVGRRLARPRLPALGVAALVGLASVQVAGGFNATAFDLEPPTLVIPGFQLDGGAFLSVSLPMTVLVLGLGNVPSLGFLAAQGYRVPANAITVAVGAFSVVNAIFGGHPAAMARATAVVGGSEAGPIETRYWAAIIAFAPALAVAAATGVILAAVAALPASYVVAMGGLAMLSTFEDSLRQAFGGALRAGPAMAFAVTLSEVSVGGIPAAFWGILGGIGVSVLLEERELLAILAPGRDAAGLISLLRHSRAFRTFAATVGGPGPRAAEPGAGITGG